MAETLTRQDSTRPDPHPTEVLMPEARAHQRRRLAVRTSIALLVVAVVVAVLVSAFLVGWLGVSGTGAGHSSRTAPARVASDDAAGVLPVGAGNLRGVACGSPSMCVAVGSGGIGALGGAGATQVSVAYRTVDGGHVWLQSLTPSTLAGMADPACSGHTCISGGGQTKTGGAILDRTVNGGASWVALPPSLGRGDVIATTCTSTSCLASTQLHVFWSSNGGLAWHAAAAPGVSGFTSLTCASASTCIGTADSTSAPFGSQDARFLMRSVDAGRSWSIVERVSDSAGLLAASCPEPSSCSALEAVGVGDFLLTSNDAGLSWTSHPVPAGSELDGLVCATSTTCFAWSAPPETAGAPPWRVKLLTNDGGRSWTTEPLTGVDIEGATCPSATSCELMGFDGSDVVVMGSRDQFRSWSSQALPVGVLHVTATACVSLMSCTAVGQATRGGFAYTTSDGGSAWSQGVMPSATTMLTSITCPTSTFCAAAGNGILTSNDAGRSWALHRYDVGTPALSGVSCVSATSCVLVGAAAASTPAYVAGAPSRDALVLDWRGGKLHRVSFPGVDSQLNAVSCANGGTCVAVGGVETYDGSYRGNVDVGYSHNGGVTWSASRLPTSGAAFFDVSCPTSRVCVAVGQSIARNGLSEPRIIASVNGGVTWQLVDFAGHEYGTYTAVACASAVHCVASGFDNVADVAIEIDAVGPRAQFVSRVLATSAYEVVGITASGVLFGVPATAPADQPLIVRAA